MIIKRGDVVIVDLGVIKGSEQKGTRPCVVLQNNLGNKLSRTTIVAPITSKQFAKEYPIHVRVTEGMGKLDSDSTILLNQIKTVDKSRLVKQVGKLNNDIMNKVDRAIKVSLGLS